MTKPLLGTLAALVLALAAGCHKNPPPAQPSNIEPQVGGNTTGGTTPSGASMDDPRQNSADPNGKQPKTPEDPK